MRLLIDTHIAVWAVVEPERLSEQARVLLTDRSNTLWFSLASLWEVAIKRSLSRAPLGRMPLSSEQALAAFIESGLQLLPLETAHVLAVEQLRPLHTDPFDRLIAAQAMVEGLRLVTHDKWLAAYSEEFLLV
jgi:PIN domain nuclease of toxin-antitoxin system